MFVTVIQRHTAICTGCTAGHEIVAIVVIIPAFDIGSADRFIVAVLCFGTEFDLSGIDLHLLFVGGKE